MPDTPSDAQRKLEQANDAGPGPVRAVAQPSLQQVAVKRGWQTLAVSLGTDVIVVVALVLISTFGQAEGWTDIQWNVLGFLLAKSVIVAAAQWVVRRFVDKSGYDADGTPAPRRAV